MYMIGLVKKRYVSKRFSVLYWYILILLLINLHTHTFDVSVSEAGLTQVS